MLSKFLPSLTIKTATGADLDAWMGGQAAAPVKKPPPLPPKGGREVIMARAAYHNEPEATMELERVYTRTALGVFVGYRRKRQPRLDLKRLFESGAIKAMPVNCWFSRTLRLFRREGRLVP